MSALLLAFVLSAHAMDDSSAGPRAEVAIRLTATLVQHVDLRPEIVREFVGEEAWAENTCWTATIGPEAPDHWRLKPWDEGVTLAPCGEAVADAP